VAVGETTIAWNTRRYGEVGLLLPALSTSQSHSSTRAAPSTFREAHQIISQIHT